MTSSYSWWNYVVDLFTDPSFPVKPDLPLPAIPGPPLYQPTLEGTPVTLTPGGHTEYHTLLPTDPWWRHREPHVSHYILTTPHPVLCTGLETKGRMDIGSQSTCGSQPNDPQHEGLSTGVLRWTGLGNSGVDRCWCSQSLPVQGRGEPTSTAGNRHTLESASLLKYVQMEYIT